MITMSTTKGDVEIELNHELAPITAANFLQYCEEGFYTDLIFHRVIDGFMVQAGGLRADMSEKLGYAPIENEAANGLSNERGAIAMARTSDPHSASSQFFINVADNNFLDYTSPNGSGWGYCVFGKVIKGMDVIDSIKAVKTTSKGPYQDVPQEPIVITSVSVAH
ncbi:MAG: peptidylprolyl isomerase [Psittacicella sp.]